MKKPAMAHSTWADCEREYLLKNFKGDYEEIAEALGRTACAVRSYCLKFTTLRRYPRWTPAEDRLFAEGLYNIEIMRITGRNYAAVRRRRERLKKSGRLAIRLDPNKDHHRSRGRGDSSARGV